jgi:N-acetylglucosaminyldiphosphoundecaprenol N-acetyl-beta-D-mannosaminyltransferase
MLLPDGIGVVIASKMKGKPLKGRVPGFDFFVELLNSGKKVFLFGSKPGVADKVDFPNIVGRRNGYFSGDDVEEIIREINGSGAEVLAVCLGAPKQEIWIDENIDKLDVKLAIGLGGAIDVLAGEVKRAPVAWQKMGLEWLYRVIKEPKRIRRLGAIPLFLWRVLWQK